MKTEPDKSPLHDEPIRELGIYPPLVEVFLRLGGRCSVGQALSRLVNKDTLLRIGCYCHVAPVTKTTRLPTRWQRLCSVSLDNFSCYQLFVRTAQHSAVT